MWFLPVDLGLPGAMGRNVDTQLLPVAEASCSMVLNSWKEQPMTECCESSGRSCGVSYGLASQVSEVTSMYYSGHINNQDKPDLKRGEQESLCNKGVSGKVTLQKRM